MDHPPNLILCEKENETIASWTGYPNYFPHTIGVLADWQRRFLAVDFL
jgi:hypothetical protein